jgi:hypothetical protein
MIISFNDITVKIITLRKELKGYLEKIYNGVRKKEPEGGPDIVIKLSWSKDLSDFKNKILQSSGYDWKRVGAQTYIGRNACFYNDKIDKRNTLIFLSEQNGKLIFEITRQEKTWGDLFRKDIDNQVTEWVNYFVYFPLFFYSERFRNLHPLHSALVRYNKKIIMIMGLENIGKTSLAFEMARREGASLLSDNISFYGNKLAFSCYEPVKVRRGEKSVVPDPFNLALRTRFRDYYVPRVIPEGGYAPDLIILPCFSGRSFTQELNAKEAAGFVLNANALVSEIKKYYSCSNIWNFGLGLEPLDPARAGPFRELAGTCRCHQMGISPQESIAQTADRIIGLYGKD